MIRKLMLLALLLVATSLCAQNSTPIRTLTYDPTYHVKAVQFIPRFAAVAVSYTKANGIAAVDVWDVSSGKIARTIPASGTITATPDGRYLVSADKSAGVRIFDLFTSTQISTASLPAGDNIVGIACPASGGQYVFTIRHDFSKQCTMPEDVDIKMVNARTGQVVQVFKGPREYITSGTVFRRGTKDLIVWYGCTTHISMSDDGAYIVASGRYPCIYVWKTGGALAHKIVQDGVAGCEFKPGTTQFTYKFGYSSNGELIKGWKVFDAATGIKADNKDIMRDALPGVVSSDGSLRCAGGRNTNTDAVEINIYRVEK